MEISIASCEKTFGSKLQDILAELHQYPELGMEEVRTTKRIREILQGLGLEIIDIGSKTGVVARLKGKGGPTIGLRSDIDGILQNEQADRPDRSKNEGKMHGCGHDTHMTALLGAAMLLCENRDQLNGDVIFLFQPAEETLTGARYLIEDCGLFQKVPMDALFGLHNYPDLPVGTVGIKEGQLMAYKDLFSVRFIGKRGHTSMPQNNIDPVVAAASFIQSVQTIISRNTDPFDSAVITVCQVHAGDARNLGMEDAFLSGDIRTITKETHTRVRERFEKIARETAAMYECQLEMDCQAIVPGVYNEKDMCALARQAAEKTVGTDNIKTPSVCLASEDFALYGQYVPTFFYFLGSGTPGREIYPWHDARFYANPCTPIYGAVLLAQSALVAQQYLT